MTRAERKQRAADFKRSLKLQWLDDFQSDVQSGETFKVAIEREVKEVSQKIARRPQEKHLIIEAWRELFNDLKAEAKRYKEDA